MNSFLKGGISSFNTKNIEQSTIFGKKNATHMFPYSNKLQSSPTLSSSYYIHTQFPKPLKIQIKPQNFKANKNFTYLTHSLHNGDATDKNGVPISYHTPPEYISYDMLLSEVGIYLDDETVDDEKLKEDFRMSSKIIQDELKRKLWIIWYKIINGYDSYAEETYKKEKQKRQSQRTRHLRRLTQLSQASQSSHLSRRKTIGGVGSDPSSPTSPTPEDKIFFQYLSKQMEYYLKAADRVTKNRYGYTEHDDEVEFFRYANDHARIPIAKSYDIRMLLRQNMNDGNINVHNVVCKFKPENFPYPDPTGFNTIFQPINNLHIFGMQLPHQFNRELLLNSMIYLFHMKIYNIADLHGCSSGTNKLNNRINLGIGCNPYDRECEYLMWEAAKKLILAQPESKCNEMKPYAYMTQKDIDDLMLTSNELGYLNNGKYYDIKMEDMTAGFLWSWNEISKIKDTSKKENSIIVHCLAGAGRTGSVMLYLILRDIKNLLPPAERDSYDIEIKEKLSQEHFGFSNFQEVITFFKAYFVNYNSNVENAKSELFKLGSKIMDSKTADLLLRKGVEKRVVKMILDQGLDVQTRGILVSKGVDDATIKLIVKQQTKSQAISSLLRQRLNRIFFFLAKEFDVKEFYTYGRATKQIVKLPDDEFSNPVKRTIDDWKTYDNNTVLSWIN
jgi:protein-tyrosine phosphatase